MYRTSEHPNTKQSRANHFLL